MSDWITANIVITQIGYLLSTIVFMVYLLRLSERLMMWGRGLLLFACVLHGIALAHIFIEPTGFGTAESVAFVGSFLAVVLYFLAGLRYPVRIAGPFLAPIITVILYSVWEGAHQSPSGPAKVLDVVMAVHIGASTLGILAFLAAFFVSVLYIYQDQQLRSKNLGAREGKGLPPQVTLDRVSARAINIGFPLYTIGIVLGAFWFVKGGWGQVSAQNVLAIGSWVVYAILLHGRLTIGWSGRRAAVMTIVGFLGAFSVALIYLSRSLA